MIHLSVYLIVKNEETRLPKTLAAASRVADEIVIVDSGSTDRTEQIARSFGARFLFNEWRDVGSQVAFAESACLHSWVLLLAADEVLSEGLIQEILEIKRNPTADGYKIRIGEMFPGFAKPIRIVKHYKLVRLYNREHIRMSGQLGVDDVIYDDPSKTKIILLRNFIHHYSYLRLERLVEKKNWASNEQALRARIEKKRYSRWRMVFALPLEFLKFFVLDRYFLYGFWGFIHSAMNAYMRFLKFAKIYEYEQLEKFSYPE